MQRSPEVVDLRAPSRAESPVEAVPRVTAVSCHSEHRFSKLPVPAIRLRAGLGVEGDAHAGATVQHRSRVAADPSQPNLRQVHLIPRELIQELATAGFEVGPGQLGENLMTRDMDLPSLPRGTRLRLGKHAVVELTGLRNPCWQIDAFRPGLLNEVVTRNPEGAIVRKAGVMAVVVADGTVRPGDGITISLPTGPHVALDRV